MAVRRIKTGIDGPNSQSAADRYFHRRVIQNVRMIPDFGTRKLTISDLTGQSERFSGAWRDSACFLFVEEDSAINVFLDIEAHAGTDSRINFEPDDLNMFLTSHGGRIRVAYTRNERDISQAELRPEVLFVPTPSTDIDSSLSRASRALPEGSPFEGRK